MILEQSADDIECKVTADGRGPAKTGPQLGGGTLPMSEQQENRKEQEYPYNDEMTIVQNFFQKHADAAQFIRSSFPDQIDFLDDTDPGELFATDGSAEDTEAWDPNEAAMQTEVGPEDADLLTADPIETDNP
jgi:hypothetical protein